MTYITIPGFENLTKQELFDTAIKHIRSTRRKSVTKVGGRCEYGGSGCNAATFIMEDKRELADSMIEAEGASSWKDLVKLDMVPKHEADFMQELQSAHDCSEAGKNFEEEYTLYMGIVAKKFNLSASTLNTMWLPEIAPESGLIIPS